MVIDKVRQIKSMSQLGTFSYELNLFLVFVVNNDVKHKVI